MTDYHSKSKAELLELLREAQAHNTRLAALVPADSSKVEMKLSHWTLTFDRNTCKIVRNK